MAKIDPREIKDLLDKDTSTNWLLVTSGIVIAASIFLSFQAITSIFRSLRDDTLPLVSCPNSYSLDAPTILRTLKSSSLREKDRFIRGFVRRAIVNQFPQSSSEAEPSLRWLVGHTTKPLRTEYEAYLDDLKKFNALIETNHFKTFYAKDVNSVRIRNVAQGEWIVEVDGFFVVRRGEYEERTTPTLTMTIITSDSTLENPEGLFITRTNIDKISDYVSGRK